MGTALGMINPVMLKIYSVRSSKLVHLRADALRIKLPVWGLGPMIYMAVAALSDTAVGRVRCCPVVALLHTFGCGILHSHAF